MAELPLEYWDACVFLSYINGEETRLPDIDALLPKSGIDIQIVTSAVSIVEVSFAKAEQDGQVLDDDVEKKIAALWEQPSPIKIAEYYPLIAHEARALIRQAVAKQWTLKPLDAIHLVTARRLGVVKFSTYDDRLYKFHEMIGFPIGPPVAAQPELPGT